MRIVATTLVILGTLQLLPVTAQGPPPPAQQIPAELLLPPATRLEGFMQPLGAIVTVGYDAIGRDVSGVDALETVSVEAREVRDAHGGVARGLIVDVLEPAGDKQTIRAHSFVDADEIPDLIRNMDRLLDVFENPTMFDHFEMHYQTRGELALTVFSNSRAVIRYAVRAGRQQTARTTLDQKQMRILRGLFANALQKLNAVAGK